MNSSSDIISLYLNFFKKRGHTIIQGAPLVLKDDPTTLFTSSGMQPLVPNLLGKTHEKGTRLVNFQNCFRAVDIDEVGDNRHTTFFRMLGNWSLGDYFKKEQITWMFEFLTSKEEGLGLDPKRLYITVFQGNDQIPKDDEAEQIWNEILTNAGLDPKEKIHYYGTQKNWWSRFGTPELMPPGEPGGPDSEVFYDFRTPHDKKFGDTCHVNCDCGRYLEIGNSVFMQYVKRPDGGFDELPKKNVDFGGGLERLLTVTNNTNDMFETNLFKPIITAIEDATNKLYKNQSQQMRIIADHLRASVYLAADDVVPSNKEQGYILRRLIRRSHDNFAALGGKNIESILEEIVNECKKTDSYLLEKFEKIKLTIIEELQGYKKTLTGAEKMIEKELKKTGIALGDELMGVKEIPSEVAFKSASSFGLGPTQLKSLGYTFDEHAYAELVKEHQKVSRQGLTQKFAGGLADHEEKTIHGHTATHLLHQALRDVLGSHVHQTGSNITTERIRFDFNFDRKLMPDEIKKVEEIVNQKIADNLPVRFEYMSPDEAEKVGAIGLFIQKYGDKVKIYSIGGQEGDPKSAYSIEFCGGPHVDFTGKLKRFKIEREESLGKTNRRIYAKVE